jgi:hypothetical protein
MNNMRMEYPPLVQLSMVPLAKMAKELKMVDRVFKEPREEEQSKGNKKQCMLANT